MSEETLDGGDSELWATAQPTYTRSQQVFLNLSRAHEVLYTGLSELCRHFELSPFQYNVLRILRGAGPEGLPSRVIGEKMLHRVPDVTRLIDRLERAGLVERRRCSEDRRVVRVRLVERSLKLLATMDQPLRALHERQFSHLADFELDTLNNMLVRFCSRYTSS